MWGEIMAENFPDLAKHLNYKSGETARTLDWKNMSESTS